jgi:hypothetical protein
MFFWQFGDKTGVGRDESGPDKMTRDPWDKGNQ